MKCRQSSVFFKNLYSNKLKNQEEMDKLLHTYDHPKLDQEDFNHISGSITHNEIEAAIKSLLKEKSPGPDRFSAELSDL
jgi:CRISPR/Cas system-associated protein Csm6